MKRFLLLSFCLLVSICLKAQWQPTNGPCGGNISCSLVNGQYVFVGTEDHGVFVSTDNGNTWTARNNGLVNKMVTSLNTHGSKLYAGTSAGLFVSDNLGITWSTVIINGNAGSSIYSIASDSQAIFIATNDSLMRSTDNGVTWNTILSGIYGYSSRTIAINGQEVYLGVDDYGLYKSADHGDSFEWINLYDQDQGYFRSFLFTGSKVLAAAGYVYESTDGGYTWVESDNGMNYHGVITLASNGNRIYAGSMNYYMDPGYGGIFYTDDAGAHWTFLGMKRYSISTLAFPGNRIIAGTSPGGIFISGNSGADWDESSTGLVRLPVQAFTMKGSTIYAAAYNEGVLKSSDKGNNWVHVNNGLPFEGINTIAVINFVLFAGGDKIYRSLDNGASWDVKFNPGFPVSCFAVLGSRIFAGLNSSSYPYQNGGVFLSEDFGETWRAVNIGLSNCNIYSLAVKGTDLYVGTDGGIFVSSDYGSSWSPINNGLDYFHVKAIGTNENFLFVSAYFSGWDNLAAIFRSADGGESWMKTGMEYSDNSYSSSFVTDGGKVITGVLYGEIQAYLTDDNGITWSAVNTGLPGECSIQSMSIMDSVVYASVLDYISYPTRGSGIWKRPLSEMIAFRLLPDTLLLGRDAGSTAALGISSSTPWILEGFFPDWFSANKFNGLGSDQIIFTAIKANPYEPPRYFQLDFLSAGVSRHLIIVQDGKLLGIDETDREGFRVYPNPTSGSIIIESVSHFDRLTVYNSLGKILFEQPVISSKTLLDLSPRGRGVYYIRLSGEKSTSIREVVVL